MPLTQGSKVLLGVGTAGLAYYLYKNRTAAHSAQLKEEKVRASYPTPSGVTPPPSSVYDLPPPPPPLSQRVSDSTSIVTKHLNASESDIAQTSAELGTIAKEHLKEAAKDVADMSFGIVSPPRQTPDLTNIPQKDKTRDVSLHPKYEPQSTQQSSSSSPTADAGASKQRIQERAETIHRAAMQQQTPPSPLPPSSFEVKPSTFEVLKNHVGAAKEDVSRAGSEAKDVLHTHSEFAKRDVAQMGNEIKATLKGDKTDNTTQVRDTPPVVKGVKDRPT